MQMVEDIYLGKVQIDLPDLDQMPGASIPNLLAQGVDQLASRVGSVTPEIIFTPDNAVTRAGQRRAQTCADVLNGWDELDRGSMQRKIRARHLVALGMTPVVVRWDTRMHRPCREVRDPLTTYPASDYLDGTTAPCDVIFAFRRSIGWLVANGYGGQVAALTGQQPTRLAQDMQMTLLEYVDYDGRMLILTGWSWNMNGINDNFSSIAFGQKRATALLEYAPQPCMTAFVPTRIALTGTAGQFDSMIGMVLLQARLMALDVAKAEKDVYPDTYLIGRPGEQPRFLDGPHDGRTGLVNIVTGGDVKEMASGPGPATVTTIDRLERNQRVTAGIPAEFGGESGTNIRTGRRGDAVLSTVIDYPIAEAQEVLSYTLMDENKACIALAKTYDGTSTRSLYVGTGTARRPVTYVADQVFTHDDHTVEFPVNGTDMNNLLIGNGQRVGLGYMSTLTAARLDPFIDDADAEHDQIIVEGLERALMQSLEQGAVQGSIPPLVIAKISRLVGSDKMELPDALVTVTQQAQDQQAAPGGPPTPDQAMAPAAVPALAGAVGGPNQNQQSLADLFMKLRRPAVAGQPVPGG
jgi:hypothetical protein